MEQCGGSIVFATWPVGLPAIKRESALRCGRKLDILGGEARNTVKKKQPNSQNNCLLIWQLCNQHESFITEWIILQHLLHSWTKVLAPLKYLQKITYVSQKITAIALVLLNVCITKHVIAIIFWEKCSIFWTIVRGANTFGHDCFDKWWCARTLFIKQFMNSLKNSKVIC